MQDTLSSDFTYVGSDQTSEYVRACESIAQEIESQYNISATSVLRIIKKTSTRFQLCTIPKNEDIIRFLPNESKHRQTLMVRPIKSASGVVVIAVMPKPSNCPHGRCIYCPGGITINTPLSYTGSEPSTRSAKQFGYDPYKQVHSKLTQLKARGHDIGKVELVIVGGTFPSMPEHYQRAFAKSCYDALNSAGTRSCSSMNLNEAIKLNETAYSRCVGFTVETKPDYCKEKQIDLMLELGITRVEIGVQSLRDEIYKIVNRGHSLNDVVEAFKLSREAGYKIVAHMMPGLPGSTPKKDIEDFQRLFQDPSFKPDMLKIYPTLVLKDTGLYKMYSAGRYEAYSDEDLIEVLVAAKKIVPPWIRIMRIQREIESKDIIAGPTSGNLRQLVLQRLHLQGAACNCIRCREIGLHRRCILSKEEVTLRRVDYAASNGQEVFLSIESIDKTTILGFLRLRKGVFSHRSELVYEQHEPIAIIRELHIYGQMLNVGNPGTGRSYQHRGYGMQLIQEAERITKDEFGTKKLAVISAVGTREYYKKLGYVPNGPYMSKVLFN